MKSHKYKKSEPIQTSSKQEWESFFTPLDSVQEQRLASNVSKAASQVTSISEREALILIKRFKPNKD